MGDPLKYGRPQLLYVDVDDGHLWRETDWHRAFGPSAPNGWRRQHALASMRAMLGTLAFAALGVRGGQQLTDALDRDPAARAREWERANAWVEQLYRQRGLEWCPRCWSHEVECTTVGYAPDSDRNKRTCRLCGHEWRPAV